MSTTYKARRIGAFVVVEKSVGIFTEPYVFPIKPARQLSLEITAACRRSPPPSVTATAAGKDFTWSDGKTDGLEFAYDLWRASEAATT